MGQVRRPEHSLDILGRETAPQEPGRMGSWTVFQEMIRGLSLPWLSAPTAKARNTSWGFPWEEQSAPATASPSSIGRRQQLQAGREKGAFPTATLIKANAADV